MGERSDGWTKAFSVPLSILPVPCYTLSMKAVRQVQAYGVPHKKCIFPKNALDTKSARRIMPFDTRYPIPAQKYAALSAAYFCATSLRYPQTRGHTPFNFQISSIILFIAAARFYASSFAGCAGETRGYTAFITHIQTYIHEIVLSSAQTCGHIARIACNFFMYIHSVLIGG